MAHDVTDFEHEVIERSRTVPVLTDFWAAWCGPCRTLGPLLEKLAADADGRWVLAKVDTEALPAVAERYHVASIPSVKLFVDGEVVDEFSGALPEARVRRWLEQAIPSPRSLELAMALERLGAGELLAAAPMLAAIVAAEPANRVARFALAEVQLRLAPATVAGLLAPLADDPELADRAEALATLARHAAEAAPTPALAPVGAALRAGDWDAAWGAVIAVLADRRAPEREAARGIGRAIVVLLGIQHPLVEKHFRAFSSALN
jgi:putative thioredoxin